MKELKSTNARIEAERDAALEALFSGVPDDDSVEVNLPSKGKFYSKFTGVTVSPLSYFEEEKILNSKGKGTNLVNALLGKCVDGIEIEDLLLMDKFYLLLKLREASYGSIYTFDINCPECGGSTRTELDLTKHLTVNEVPDDLEDPRTVHLPKLGVDVQVRFPRVREEGFIEDTESSSKMMNRFVISIDGNTDPVFISKALKRMHIMDLKKISREITLDQYGVDPRFIFECPHCKYEALTQLPFGADFFSVS